jgi:hypothetical protein
MTTNGANNLAQIIWINIIAISHQEQGAQANITTNFYGLTHVNNEPNDSGNFALRFSTNTRSLTLRLLKHNHPLMLRYALIPTSDENNTLDIELAKYCTPSIHTKWSKLEGYENQNIHVLTLRTITLTRTREIKPTPQPIVTFSFPSIIDISDLMELEGKAASRHHCTMLPCKEFSICPTTRQIPIPTSPPHLHCMSDKCVRFFEMSSMPPSNPQI